MGAGPQRALSGHRALRPQGGCARRTALAEDLASHGFIALTVDHPYHAPVVELWPTREVIEEDDAKRDLTRRAVDAVRAEDVAAVADRLASLDEEIEEVIAPECTVVVSGDLQDQVTGLTDEPMIEAQILARYPRTVKTVGPLSSLARPRTDFRVRSADFRDALARRLTRYQGCHSRP